MASSTDSVSFILPDFFTNCTLNAAVNPYYVDVAAESRAWAKKYDSTVSDRKRVNIGLACGSLLGAYTFPYANHDQFRMICDWIATLFIIDEITDEQDGKDVEETARCVMSSLEDETYDDGSLLAEMVKSFMERIFPLGSPDMFRRFTERVKQYLQKVTREAQLRQHTEIPDMETFVPMRRHSSGVVTCLALVEYAAGVEIPDTVWQNDVFMNAVWAVVDFVSYTNDIYSYDMEQAEGTHGNNIVSVIMKEKNCSIQDAVNHAGEICNGVMQSYFKAKDQLIKLGFEKEVIKYVDAIGCWTIGNLEWSFKSFRYFGTSGDDVRKTGIVELRPRIPTGIIA